MLNRWIDLYCRALGALMVLCLTLMVVMVFTNVVLRYAFNSGINVSEELSRWLFVWMTFMGSVVALRQRGHLGTDMLVARLSVRGKRAVLGLCVDVVLLCAGVSRQLGANPDQPGHHQRGFRGAHRLAVRQRLGVCRVSHRHLAAQLVALGQRPNARR